MWGWRLPGGPCCCPCCTVYLRSCCPQAVSVRALDGADDSRTHAQTRCLASLPQRRIYELFWPCDHGWVLQEGTLNPVLNPRRVGPPGEWKVGAGRTTHGSTRTPYRFAPSQWGSPPLFPSNRGTVAAAPLSHSLPAGMAGLGTSGLATSQLILIESVLWEVSSGVCSPPSQVGLSPSAVTVTRTWKSVRAWWGCGVVISGSLPFHLRGTCI